MGNHPDGALPEPKWRRRALDFHASVQFEYEARAAYEEKPWVKDKAVADVIRATLVQTNQLVPPRCVADEAAYAKLPSRVLSAAEATRNFLQNSRPSC